MLLDFAIRGTPSVVVRTIRPTHTLETQYMPGKFDQFDHDHSVSMKIIPRSGT
jgi:hypothetical protein